MTNNESQRELPELFWEVAREPVIEPPESGDEHSEYHERELQLVHWFDGLRHEFPLLAFQPWSYYRLQDTELPSTRPLQVIIDSILEDEGLDPRTDAGLEPLPAEVDRRRRYLMQDEPSARINQWSDAGDRERIELEAGTIHFEEAPELYPEPVPGEAPQHEALHVGYRICRLTEQRLRARYRGDAERANEIQTEEIDPYLRRIGALRRRGAPSGRPSDECISRLVEEARSLIELFWEALPIRLSGDFTSLLERQEVSESDRQLWALVLTVPVFSRHEVRVLLGQREEYAEAPERPGHPTARRIAIHCVAHRLDEDSEDIDRIHAGGGGGEGFRYGPNPFQ